MTASNIGTAHAFTTRFGGVSGGIYASLNLGQNLGDDPAHVRRNYEILGAALGFDPDGLVFTRQVHGTVVRRVTKKDRLPPYAPIPYEADSLITSDTDVPLVISTADCVPILLFNPAAGAAGAVHAGWRGTMADIAGSAVREMVRCFGCNAADIRAAIGPSISMCCFETGSDVKDAAVRLLGGEAARYVTAAGEKYMVNLKGINSLLLKRAGLRPENIEVSPECTSCLSDKYWSHRVTNGQRGSQAAVIMMKGSLH